MLGGNVEEGVHNYLREPAEKENAVPKQQKNCAKKPR